MGRPKKLRNSRYKTYYDKDAQEDDVPESTERSQTAAQPNLDERLVDQASSSSEDDSDDQHEHTLVDNQRNANENRSVDIPGVSAYEDSERSQSFSSIAGSSVLARNQECQSNQSQKDHIDTDQSLSETDSVQDINEQRLVDQASSSSEDDSDDQHEHTLVDNQRNANENRSVDIPGVSAYEDSERSQSFSSIAGSSVLARNQECQSNQSQKDHIDTDQSLSETDSVQDINEQTRQHHYVSSGNEDSSADSDSSSTPSSCWDADISSSDGELIPARNGAAHGSFIVSHSQMRHRERSFISATSFSRTSACAESTSHRSSSEGEEHEEEQEPNRSSESALEYTDDRTSTSASSENELEQEQERTYQENNVCLDEPRTKVDPFSRLKSVVKDVVNLNVNITLGEIFTNLLVFVKNHNISHLEKENIMKFANSLLNSGKVLPSSRFLLDEYFYSKEGMVYHFFCSDCSEFLGDVPAENPRPSQVCCPNSTCKRINLLSDLSQASFFVTFDIPSQVELLLRDGNLRSKFVNPVDLAGTPEPVVLRDVYDGKMYRDFAKAVKNDPDNATKQVISFVLSVDRAALCSFSGQGICPCFLMLLELPPVLRMKHLLLAGLWFGRVKEKMDLFLPPIVQQITKLSTCGFTADLGNDRLLSMRAFLVGCCTDSVGRFDVQGIHAHRGECPCSWCLIEGEEFGGARIFRFDVPCAPRTLDGLLQDANKALRTGLVVNGVKYLCPLAPAPLFHSIDGFVVDQMHAKDEGTTKAFLKAWLGEDGKTTYYIGAPSKKKLMNARIKEITPPKEFRKAVRYLKDISFWTGREFENFGLFLSIPVVMNILPERYLKHWAMYIQAIFILLLSEIPVDTIDIAENLIEEFCRQTETLYGLHMMRFNLHILRHFSDNCRRWGNIYAVSAYAFEAGNQRVKKLVHDCNFIPNQVCRGISEGNALVLLKTLCESNNTTSFQEDISRKPTSKTSNLAGNVILKSHKKMYRPSEEELWFIENSQMDVSHLEVFQQISRNGCCYESSSSVKRSKTDNSYVQLEDGKIMNIKRILHNTLSDEVWIFCVRVWCDPSPYVPQSVIRSGQHKVIFQFVVTSIDEDLVFLNVNDIQRVCVSIKLTEGHYISPMPNIINMF